MPPSPPMAVLAASVAERWRREPVTDGFLLDSVDVVAGVVRVAFRWRRDPQRYLVDLPTPGAGVETAGDEASAADVVTELGWWLMEELDTGLLLDAERTDVGGDVLLGRRRPARSDWFVFSVPLARPVGLPDSGSGVVVRWATGPMEPIADPGRHLDRCGLDGAPGRAAVAAGTLVAWLQVRRRDGDDPVVGQLVLTAAGPGAAAIGHLEVLDQGAFQDLLAVGRRVAAEAGRPTVLEP